MNISPIRSLSETLVEVGLATSLRQANGFIRKGQVYIESALIPKFQVCNTDGLLVIACPLVLYCGENERTVYPRVKGGFE